jgi:hypothetical protein
VNGNITTNRSSYGSGIGTGHTVSNGTSKIGNLVIVNGNIMTSSSSREGYGSGIGTGYDVSNGTSKIENVTIVNGNITASSLSSEGYGSGIGTGYGVSNGTSKIGNLTIVNGNITAISSSFDYASGIGTGYGVSNGTSMIENLTIVNGNITANSSSFGSGIGTGYGKNGGTSVIQTLTVLGGRIKVNGTESGIGSGFEGTEVELLRFSGTVILFCTVMNITKFPMNSSSIVLSDASLTIATPQNRVFGVNPIGQGSLNLNIVYENVTKADSEPLSSLNRTFLQIGHFVCGHFVFQGLTMNNVLMWNQRK